MVEITSPLNAPVPNFVGGYARRNPDWHFLSVGDVPQAAWDELEYA